MRFEEGIMGGWQEKRLSQDEAEEILGVCSMVFRRYIVGYRVNG